MDQASFQRGSAEHILVGTFVAGAVATAATVTENKADFRMHYYVMPGVSFVVATIIVGNPMYGLVAAAGNVALRTYGKSL
jgi:uncharacterized protein YqhQ